MRNDILERKSEIENWVFENKPKASIAKELKCKIDTLDSYLRKWNINYKGNVGAKGYKKSPMRKTALEYINSTTVKAPTLRLKLIEDGVKKKECEICKNTMWMGKPISLELHHIDGNHWNNDFTNLQILCPNCHSMTPNHSKNKPR